MNQSQASNALPQVIQARLEAAGMRRTLLTRAVLGIFLTQSEVDLSHSQAMSLLQARGLTTDRVTLYRLLDRLAACGVLTRRSNADARVWRYRLAPLSDVPQGPLFECHGCQRRYPLVGPEPTLAANLGGLFSELTKMGHRDLSIHGTCPSCADHQRAPLND
jgi:Fur family transcriptional regulator, ferric uptake regulator